MISIPSREALSALLKERRISKRLLREIRYVPEEIRYVSERDFLAITTKSGNEGVLLFERYVAPFTLAKRSSNSKGRIEAIICDICATWQRGTNSAVISFKTGENSTASYLVCADLDCSLHVRNLTDPARLSRTQLREDITPEQRVRRLRQRIAAIIDNL